ncbi:hypothetical protein BVRB_1g002470 [Beta vulgaris subsp. vulgaris]|nr:hypothetical protein BVRB_1g002470 [Beta vulgaris subsp. vulgaris]
MGALATRGRLKDRHILDEGCCQHCRREDESITHAIFRCSLVSPIWENSPFVYYVRDGPISSFLDFFVWIVARLEKNDLLSFLALAWAAWSYRNSVTFEEPWLNVQVSVMGFLKLVSEYKNYAASVYRAEPAALAYQSRARTFLVVCFLRPRASIK